MFLWTLNNYKDDKIYCNSNRNSGRICLQNIGYYLKNGSGFYRT